MGRGGGVSRGCEVVTLVLRGVAFRSLDYSSLEDFLEKALSFSRVEVEEVVVGREEQLLAPRARVVELVSEREMVRYSGSYVDAVVVVEILGSVKRGEEVVKVNGEEQKVFVAKYEMVKFVSKSGYALQRLVEELEVELGLHAEERGWAFHRVRDLEAV